MKKQDARSHNQETQYELRKQIVRLRKKGVSNRETAEITGISIAHTSTIWQKYKHGGIEAIKPGKRGRRHGMKRVLNKEQESSIKKLIIDKTPDQLKLPFALWNRTAVQQIIKKKFGRLIPLRTLTDYLRRWGFTAQKPVKQAYEQNPKKLRQWLEEEYPQISKRAKKEKAEIHWADETGINNTAYNAKGFSPKGTAPIIRLNAKRSSVNMISSISNYGKVRFMLYKENFISKIFIKFLSRIIKDSSRKVFMIVDNHRVHHSKVVTAWINQHKEHIELFFIPPYCPEYNPDEYLNSDLKSRIRSGLPAKNEKELRKKTMSFMSILRWRPYHVRSYFKHPLVKYAS